MPSTPLGVLLPTRLCAAFAVSCGLASTVFTAATAATYEAMCGNAECRITLTESEIVTPYGVIPASRVANWGGSGSSNSDLIMGAATTYLLGPVGVVGFLAKTHDYNYAITGYDRQGDRTSIQIRFLNSKPAKHFVEEMLLVTGLGMGQTRTAAQIKELERRMSAEGVVSVRRLRMPNLEEDSSREGPSGAKRLASSSSRQCWSDYLKNNVDIKVWVLANPEAAKKVQSRFASC
jgi:hypothetical protein